MEIQEILAERKFREMLAKQSKELQARIAAEQAQSAMLTSSIAGSFDEFEDWMQERKLQQKMLNCGQLKTGELKEDEIYDDDEYELY